MCCSFAGSVHVKKVASIYLAVLSNQELKIRILKKKNQLYPHFILLQFKKIGFLSTFS